MVSQTDSVSRWSIREIEAAILANASSLGRTNGCSKHSSVRSSLHYVADPKRYAERDIMKHIVSLLILALLAGCATVPIQQNIVSSVPLNKTTRQMLGNWLCGEHNVIQLIQDDAHVRIYFEKNDTWRIDISNVKLVGDEIHFITTHFLRDGSSHPFNGTPCNTIIRQHNDQLE